MALVLRVPSAAGTSISGVNAFRAGREATRLKRRRVVSKINGYSHAHRLYRVGISSSYFGENKMVVLRVRSALESEFSEEKMSFGKICRPALECGVKINFERLRNIIAADVVHKFLAKLQLLGVFTALAMGISAPAAGASSFGPVHYAVGLDRKRVESCKLTEIEEADLHPVRSVMRPRVKVQQNEGTPCHGVANIAEDDGSDQEVQEDSDEEAMRELEEWRANPYAITVPLKIVGLRGSVPPVWLKDFMLSQGKRVKLTAEFKGSLWSIFSELKSALETQRLTPQSLMAADLVTIGGSWLEKAVSGGLIRPIENAEIFDWYNRMGGKWQSFVRRDDLGKINPGGKVWGVPYRWGTMVIAYNHRKLQKCGIEGIKDWPDLWKPELAGKISMVAAPREIVGAVLKSLGASYNVKDFETDVPGGRDAVKERFLALQKQVLLFDNEHYLKTLGAGDSWVAVGWSVDVIPFAKRTSNITVIAPQSGSSLWADLWAIPAATTIKSSEVGGRIRGPSPLILQWLDFCLQPARATSFQHNVIVGISPLALSGREVSFEPVEGGQGTNLSASDLESSTNRDTLPGDNSSVVNQVKDPETNPGKTLSGLLTPDILSKCEFLEPLTEKALEDFNWLLPKHTDLPSFSVRLIDFVKSGFLGMFGRTANRA